MRPSEIDASIILIEGRNPFIGGMHIRQVAQFGVHIFQNSIDVYLILFFINIVIYHEGVGGSFFNPDGDLNNVRVEDGE
jgi:hypothetical protein